VQQPVGQKTKQEPQDGRWLQKSQLNGVAGESSTDSTRSEKMVRIEVEKEIPMCVSLPIEVISPEQTFPFLNTTLADLGIEESAVKEQVVWVDTKRTLVKSKSGKLKEKEVTVLEVRVRAQHPGRDKCQEVLYSTEWRTDRAHCRSGVTILPWPYPQPAKNEMTLALDTQPQCEKNEDSKEVPSVE
ncbi:hypothetical protein P4O66_010579, partial [Electrophorus voltai]